MSNPNNPQAETPEFVRVKDATRLFGIGRSTLFELITEQKIKSHLVRGRGNVSGIRLISTDSLRAFITRHGAK